MDQPILPALDLAVVISWLAQYFFLSLRIGAFILAGPGFGGRFVPLQVRIVATMVLVLPLVGRVPVPDVESLSQLSAIGLAVTELLIGLTAGLILTILFSAASIAGDRIANTAGLGFAAQMDPTAGAQVPVVAQLFGLFLLAIFVATDGHLVAFRILYDSYQFVPIGSQVSLDALIAGGLLSGARMFALGMQIMLPVVAVLLLLNLTIGIVTRSAPQLNIFSFGFPVTMTSTFILLYLTVPGTADAFDMLIRDGLTIIGDTLMEAGNG